MTQVALKLERVYGREHGNVSSLAAVWLCLSCTATREPCRPAVAAWVLTSLIPNYYRNHTPSSNETTAEYLSNQFYEQWSAETARARAKGKTPSIARVLRKMFLGYSESFAFVRTSNHLDNRSPNALSVITSTVMVTGVLGLVETISKVAEAVFLGYLLQQLQAPIVAGQEQDDALRKWLFATGLIVSGLVHGMYHPGRNIADFVGGPPADGYNLASNIVCRNNAPPLFQSRLHGRDQVSGRGEVGRRPKSCQCLGSALKF
jgi:hypothetical protein